MLKLSDALRLCLAVAVAASAAPAHAGRCSATPLTLVSYNIRLDTAVDGDNRWANRRAAMGAQLRLWAPDIIGFQEVLPNQRADLSSELPDYRLIGAGRDGGDRGEGVPIAIRRDTFTMQGYGTRWLSPTPDRPGKGWDAAYPRIFTWARLRGRTGNLLVINTHFDNVGKTARIESARELRSWIAANARGAERIVILGDFNSYSDSEELRILRGEGTARAVAELGRTSTPAPLAQANSFNGFGNRGEVTQPIDHIFLSGTIGRADYAVVEQMANGKYISDHFPVMARVMISPCGAPSAD